MNRQNRKISAVFPPIGQRIVRSVVAVALSFLVYLARGSRGIPFYTAPLSSDAKIPHIFPAWSISV